MKRIYIIFFAIVLTGFIMHQLKGPNFRISSDMAIAQNYIKRGNVPQKDSDFGFTHYTKETEQLLGTTQDIDLSGFRCSDSFVRTDQGAYILENEKIKNGLTRRIKNDDFIEFMRKKEPDLPKGKKILTGKICETENKIKLIFYSIGMYDTKTVDNISIRKVIAYSNNNNAFVQKISENPLNTQQTFEITTSKAHIRCDQPFHISRNNILFILCEESGNWISNYLVYSVDLKDGSLSVLGKCMNSFKDKSQTICD